MQIKIYIIGTVVSGVIFWCNGPVRDRSLCLQADIDTLGRIVDDDALSSC